MDCPKPPTDRSFLQEVEATLSEANHALKKASVVMKRASDQRIVAKLLLALSVVHAFDVDVSDVVDSMPKLLEAKSVQNAASSSPAQKVNAIFTYV